MLKVIKKLNSLISINAKVIFLIFVTLYVLGGTCPEGCLQPQNLPQSPWMVPYANAYSKLIGSLGIAIPLLILISLFDHFVSVRKRAIFVALTSVVLITLGLAWTFTAKEMEGLAAIGFLITTVIILIPLNILNITQAIKEFRTPKNQSK